VFHLNQEAYPLVSIVTPCFNAGGTLARALDSILGQSYPNIECIVIDGGSTDNTLQILESYAPRLGYWISEQDRGIADAFNKGVSAARGSLVGILNADDWLEPNAVAAVVEVFLQNPDAVIYGDMRYWLTDARSILAPARKVVAMSRLPYHPATFVPAVLYTQYGLFNETYRYAMDTDFLVRLFLRGVHFAYVPRVLANMTSGGISTRNVEGPYRERREIYRRAGMSPLTNTVLYAFFTLRMYLRIAVERYLLHKPR
jgi:glycosyltransferase involved in cell wall biosynthesis